MLTECISCLFFPPQVYIDEAVRLCSAVHSLGRADKVLQLCEVLTRNHRHDTAIRLVISTIDHPKCSAGMETALMQLLPTLLRHCDVSALVSLADDVINTLQHSTEAVLAVAKALHGVGLLKLSLQVALACLELKEPPSLDISGRHMYHHSAPRVCSKQHCAEWAILVARAIGGGNMVRRAKTSTLFTSNKSHHLIGVQHSRYPFRFCLMRKLLPTVPLFSGGLFSLKRGTVGNLRVKLTNITRVINLFFPLSRFSFTLTFLCRKGIESYCV